jgi:hypothetical protein
VSCSLNFPDRYIRVIEEGVPRIDPFEDTAYVRDLALSV